MELHREQVNLGEICVQAKQKELLTISFVDGFFTQTQITNAAGTVVKTLSGLTPDSVKYNCESQNLELMISPDKKKAEVKLKEPAKKNLNNLWFTMQNETNLYEFSLMVKVEKEKGVVPQQSQSAAKLPQEGAVHKTVENVNDTVIINNVNKDNYRIVLCDKNAQFENEPDKRIDFDGFAFKEESGDRGWYLIECDGQQCTIVIKKKDGIDVDAKIPVKVRSGEDGVILLRIFKASGR